MIVWQNSIITNMKMMRLCQMLINNIIRL